MTDAPPHLIDPALAPAPHGFFGREGGGSQGIYASLNCGPGSADDPATVASNRARVAAALGAETLLTARQVHSAQAVTVDAPFADDARPQADAFVTATPGLAVGALAADCAPVLLADVEAGVVAAAHAGWRGAFGGVLEATVDAMESLGARRGRIRARIGACISQAVYEVGPEFVERFLDDDPEAARWFAGGLGDRALFDLPGYCLGRLRAAGVGDAGWIGRCAFSEPEAWFSHRRARRDGAPDYGRHVAAIAPPAS